MSNFYAEEIQRQIDQIKDPEERSRKQAEYEDLSVFRDILPFIPINVKQYAYYMMGGKGELNENDLTDAELNVLYNIANKKLNDPNFSPSRYSDSNKITYPDYETGDFSDISRGNPAGKEVQTQEQLKAWERGEIKLNLEAPDGKTKTYSYEEYVQDFPGIFDDPLSVIELAKKLKDPNYSMKTTIGKANIVSNEDDTYSVQDQYDFEYGKGKGESSYDSFSLSPYAIARNLAAKRKNEGSPVDINLGSEEYIKRQGMSNGDEMKKFSKGPSRPSRSTEYKRKLEELEDFIAKNRLVSKEAQMSSMSGEGYTDPRFFKTTGNPLIDQYGMRPFPAEGSGQVLTTKDLGMEGPEMVFNPSVYGQYSPTKDTIIYKDVDKGREGAEDYTSKEATQKHEIVHRSAQRSGWINNFYNSPYLKKKAKSLAGERGRRLAPLVNEALAHSYEYDADDYSKNKDLKERINFRASRYNLKDPEKIADEIFNNIEDLRKDFEQYLEEVNVEYLPNNRISYTTTRTNKANGGEANYLQSALDMLTESAPVTEAPEGTFDVGSIEPFNPLEIKMREYESSPIRDIAMMIVSPVSKVTSAARLAQLANPTDEVFATATRKEILDYIKTIPLKVRLALRADDSIPLRGKYAILDSDKIDFYEDVVNLNKLPKNFKTGDNTLGKIYMEKNKIPSRVDMSDPLVNFKPRPYFEEIVDKKGIEKIKLYFPKTGRLEPYGTQTKYRQKTLTNPSKEQLDKLFKGIKESDLKKELARVQKAERLDVPNAATKDMAEATQLRMGTPYRTSEEISKELLDLQGTEKLDLDLLAKLRKEFNL